LGLIINQEKQDRARFWTRLEFTADLWGERVLFLQSHDVDEKDEYLWHFYYRCWTSAFSNILYYKRTGKDNGCVAAKDWEGRNGSI